MPPHGLPSSLFLSSVSPFSLGARTPCSQVLSHSRTWPLLPAVSRTSFLTSTRGYILMVFSVPVAASVGTQSLRRLSLSLPLSALSSPHQNRPPRSVPSCDGFSSILLGSVPAVPTPLSRSLHVFRYLFRQLLLPAPVSWLCVSLVVLL